MMVLKPSNMGVVPLLSEFHCSHESRIGLGSGDESGAGVHRAGVFADHLQCSPSRALLVDGTSLDVAGSGHDEECRMKLGSARAAFRQIALDSSVNLGVGLAS